MFFLVEEQPAVVQVEEEQFNENNSEPEWEGFEAHSESEVTMHIQFCIF